MPGVEPDRPREADADADDRPARHAGPLDRGVDELARAVERARALTVDVERDDLLGEDRVREVRDRHADVTVAEVKADRRTGRAVQSEQDGRAAAAGAGCLAGRILALDHEPRLHELTDQARDGGAAQPGQTGEVRPARETAPAQSVDDALAVVVPQSLQ